MTGAILKVGCRNVSLCYTARRAANLEKALDDSLVGALKNSDRVGVIVKYIAYGADISEDEAYDLYDEFIGNGGTMSEITDTIVEALQNDGYIAKRAVEAAKKLEAKLRHETPRS